MGQIIRIADAMLMRYEGGPRLFELGRIEVKKKADGIPWSWPKLLQGTLPNAGSNKEL
jgi:hypothetical protein